MRGYRSDRPDRLLTADGRLVATQGDGLGRPRTIPNEVVRRIKRERLKGKSLATIAGALNAEDVPTAQGGRRWDLATVRYTLSRAS